MSGLFYDPGDPNVGKKTMLATVAYDNPDASYTFSIQRTRSRMPKAAYLLLTGYCHVDDARNIVCREFLDSDCTELVFLDADVSWEPESLLRLCAHQHVDLVGGVYPFRRDDEFRRGNMPVRMIEGITRPDEHGLMEVEGLPAGFLRIGRHVIETLAREANCWVRGQGLPSVPIIFERTYESGNRYGGDIAFCRKARKAGVKVYADYELRLGHAAKQILWDSLGAGLRRQSGTTLRHVASKIKDGSWALHDLTEARRFVSNDYGALEDILSLAVIHAKKANGPILECGSGLTTILMAAATEHEVYCLEHDRGWAAQLEAMASSAGTTNIALCMQPLRNGWYDLADIKNDLPERFALALIDGPPRSIGDRMKFFGRLAGRCDSIIVDDMDAPKYALDTTNWAKKHGFDVSFVPPRAALIRHPERKELVA